MGPFGRLEPLHFRGAASSPNAKALFSICCYVAAQGETHGQRHPSHHRDRKFGAPESRFLHWDAWPAAGEEDSQLRRSCRPIISTTAIGRDVRARSSPSFRGSTRHQAGLESEKRRRPPSAFRKARSATGPIVLSRRASPTIRRPGASAKRRWRSGTATEPGSRWSGSKGVRPTRQKAWATCRRSMRSAASTASVCCWPRPRPTAAILTDVFGFVAEGREGATARYRAPGVERGRNCRSEDGGRIPRGAARRRLRPSHRVSRGRRRRASGDGEKARRGPSAAPDRAEGSQLFPLGLFPRAWPCAVRNRHRSARLCRRRTPRVAWAGAQTAALPRRPPRRKSKRRCQSSNSSLPIAQAQLPRETP